LTRGLKTINIKWKLHYVIAVNVTYLLIVIVIKLHGSYLLTSAVGFIFIIR
jgi:hypothetical protein